MNKDKLIELYKKYGLTKDDVFKHQHYLIITRSGIEKIQAVAKIKVNFDVIKCEKDFCVVNRKNEVITVNTKNIGVLTNYWIITTNRW